MQPVPADPYPHLRGLLLDEIDLAPRVVDLGEPLMVPQTGPVYSVEPGSVADLRALAERYAGTTVTEGRGPNFSPELTSFDTGDGWFLAPTDSLDGEAGNGGGWSWYEAAWRNQTVYHPVPVIQGPCAAPPNARTERAALAFFERIGVPVRLDPPTNDCIGDLTRVDVSVLVDDLPLIGLSGIAWVDGSGTVVEAGGPLLHLESLGDVELAPATEVLRRLVHGPGLVPGDCVAPCALSTDGATLGLAYATNGGWGGHDHTPGGVVDAPAGRLLVPAVLVPAVGEYPQGSDQGVLAVSSALLVDDPAQAGAARRADATSTDPTAAGPACASDPAAWPVIAVCASRPHPAAGNPVLLTAYGERYEPVGASGCRPLFTLDPGDGSGAQSFLPRSGTLLTARVAHVYAAPGTYTAVVRSVSRCSSPAPPGGTEPEFDESAQTLVTVTG
ncbi:hypothetical protein E4P39_07355 [Blastococcus sp. CT_GayMR19]|uniref:hypothetical protein n=1 Tax=Blastococcus sp. CT_GayMR19 TaxID=2559608 RepID=UPI0010749989|nr:hypothetical protein [Blastococcus sp. CT_GayMR19]TFV76718.1 hypothetical protein E4P39_07355 [Blastococcus sp. CT_GayMR19]